MSISQTGPYVQYLQLALKRSGFLSGSIDGIFGPETLASVLQFQQAYGLKETGTVNRLMWRYLTPFLSGYFNYTVKRGDTLSQLADTYFTTQQAIRTANPGLTAEGELTGQRIIIPFGFRVVPTNVAYSYFLVDLIVEGLKARYPFLESGSIGKSIMGSNLYFLKIGEGPTEAFYNASHHANEWITTPVLLKFIEDYASAYVSNERLYDVSAQALYQKTMLYAVPLVNPDGVDLVNGAIPPDSTFFKQAMSISASFPDIGFPNGWKANIAGTDLNLNYPAGWENAKQIKYELGFDRPAPRDFVGTNPLSAPESQAIYDFTLRHNFMLTLSYHTQGRVIYWKYLDYEPARSYEIALRFGEASGYHVEQTPITSGYAGYKDWYIQTFDRPGYTIEAGEGENPLPITQFDTIYKNNIGILSIGLQEA